jgi:CreA protein
MPLLLVFDSYFATFLLLDIMTMLKLTSITLAAVLLLQVSLDNGVDGFAPRSVSLRVPSVSLTATNDNNDLNPNGSPLQLQLQKIQQQVAQGLTTAAFAATLAVGTTMTMTAAPAPATAIESKIIGQLQGSGLVFKDTLQIESFDDPKVKGVTLYISTFQKPITERMGKGFFTDPAYASVGCAKTGPVSIADNIVTGSQGEEVFEESRSLLFKTLRVQRIYDVDKHTVVYVSFNTRFDKGDDSNKSRFKSSLCAVNLELAGTPIAAIEK